VNSRLVATDHLTDRHIALTEGDAGGLDTFAGRMSRTDFTSIFGRTDINVMTARVLNCEVAVQDAQRAPFRRYNSAVSTRVLTRSKMTKDDSTRFQRIRSRLAYSNCYFF
jgi:hypothetical protein